MLKVFLSATLLLIGGFAHAGDPEDVVAGVYASYPWKDLPPGGHGAWHQETGAAWGTGAADAGLAFLAGPGAFTRVETEVTVAGGAEVRVLATLWDGDDAVHVLNFGMIGDDDEDDRWRIIEVFTDSGEYLSDVLARK